VALITAAEVAFYSNISAMAPAITASGLIPMVQERIIQICNNDFATDLMVIADCTFNATAATITLKANDWKEFGFDDGDDIVIVNSYRNDGYYTVSSFVNETATLSAGTVKDELSGRSIMFAVVKWPMAVKRAAAQMIAYDYDTRPQRTPGVKSFTLGPLSETYNDSASGADKGLGLYGYPLEILGLLPTPVVRMR
jgi:hypothetical protein